MQQNKQQQANSYFQKAEALTKAHQYEAANQLYKKALQLFIDLKGWKQVMNCQSYWGYNYHQMAQYDKAIDQFQAAQATIEQYFTPENKDLISIYNNLATCYNIKGASDQAHHFYKKSLALRQYLYGEQNQHTALGYNNLGRFFEQKGNRAQALSCYQKALAIYEKTTTVTPNYLATTYMNIGNIHHHKGDYYEAIKYHKEALHIRQTTFDQQDPKIAQCHSNLGACYIMVNDHVQSFYHHQLALQIRQQVFGKNSINTVISYNNLGFLFFKKKDYTQALVYHHKALAIRKEKLGKQHPKTAISYHNIANTLTESGQYTEALEYHQKALKISIDTLPSHHPDIARRYLALAQCYQKQEQWGKSLSFFQLILQHSCPHFNQADIYTNPSIDDCQQPLIADILLTCLYEKGKALWQLYQQTKTQRNLLIAEQTLQLVVQFIDYIRQEYEAEQSKLLLAEQGMDIYETLLEVLWEMQQQAPEAAYFQKAFTVSEKGKAILLLLSRKDIQAKMSANIPEELLTQEKALQGELAALAKKKLQAQKKASPQQAELIKNLTSQHFELHESYKKLIRCLENDYPRYFNLKYKAEIVSVANIQQTLLDEKTALIEYFAGNKHLYCFVLTVEKCHFHRLPKPHDFAQQIKRFLNALKSMQKRRYLQLASQLYTLLLAPIASFFKKNTQLLVIPDAELLYLPFEALLTSMPIFKKLKEPSVNYPNLPYLLNQFAIHYHYSATLLYDNRQQMWDVPSPFKHDFLGIAPEYVSVAEVEKQPLQATSILALDDVLRNGLVPLKHTRTEVEGVQQLFKNRGLTTATLLDKSASLANFYDHAPHCRYLLVAAHGEFNEQQPDLSRLIFENSSTPHSLYPADAYRLSLQANLVVLSACESGVGQLAKGEGMMGMNRGFMYAGVQNLIFTLFRVDDRASSELVLLLFEHILLSQLPYAQALQQAKKNLIEQGHISPKNWAGFVLVGSGSD